ncbi:MAG: glycyl-radical enzyme activating protein [Clostridiales bacterium]|nr:glycyl-radical enzyme activating protein [Clostridiales bacterium]
MTGVIFDVKEMAVHDGPGIRTTVFFKGCPLSCVWCHNPEGLSTAPELAFKASKCKNCGLCKMPCEHDECKKFGRCVHICPEDCLEIIGKTCTSEALSRELIKSGEVLGENFGGFTFSGGEPLMQGGFLIETLKKLKGYHLCIETSGYADKEVFREVISLCDYVIMDLKIIDEDEHIKYTGVSNKKILENFEILKNSGKEFLIRTPLIPNITDGKANVDKIKALTKGLKSEFLEYNPFAESKYKMLGKEYPYKKIVF